MRVCTRCFIDGVACIEITWWRNAEITRSQSVVRRITGQKSCSGRGGPACNSLFPTSSAFHAPVWRQADEPGILAARTILHHFRRTGYKLHCQPVLHFFTVSSATVRNYKSRYSDCYPCFVLGKYGFDSWHENFYLHWDSSWCFSVPPYIYIDYTLKQVIGVSFSVIYKLVIEISSLQQPVIWRLVESLNRGQLKRN
jgi:hypothetical protein